MHNKSKKIIFQLLSFFTFLFFDLQYTLAQQNLVKAKLIAQQVSAQDLKIGVNLKIEDGWHIYWENSGEAGSPTKVNWDLPIGSNVSPIKWPAPEKFAERGNIITFGYKKEVTLLADASLPNLNQVKAEVRWLVCRDICIPGTALISLENISNQPVALIEEAQNLIPQINNPLITKLSSYQESNGDKYLLIKLDENKINKNLKIENHFQVFNHKSIPVTHAEISPSALIRIPIKGSLSDKPSGIIVISNTITNTKNDLNLTWNFNGIPNFSEKIENTSFSKLNYRYEQHEKAAPTQQQDSSLPFIVILAYAFIGGLILNLMPCVLPVISIKVLGFIENNEKSKAQLRKSAIAFSSGVIACFLALASVVTILRQAGVSVGWGFQFHHPEFVFSLIVIIFILALGFFDLYTIGVSFLSKTGQKVDKLKSGFFKDFLDGALATALSTPCSAPLLGVSLIVAFSQSAIKTFLIFGFIGLGLALPYALISTNPRLTALLPQPGPWMHRVRHFMGFCLLGTLIWLLFVLDNLQEHSGFWALSVLLGIYILFWLRSWQNESRNKKRFVLAYALTSLCIFGFIPNIITSLDKSEKIDWQPYSAELVNELTSSGKNVFIDFTADWCVTCKANELYTISSSKVKASLKKNDIIPLKADWTKEDPQITEALKSYGANGVPLYVVISALEPDKPKVLPTNITPSILIEAFESASIK